MLHGRSFATAESVTAGLIAQRCAAADGSMEWFRGGIVAYQSGVKRAVLDVAPGPVVTPRVACQMALGAARLLSADVAVGVTGVAGPEPLDGERPGIVIVGVAIGGHTEAFRHELSGPPEGVCSQACAVALGDVIGCLRQRTG
jgi:nicotinamide-nucleotide amidase